MALRVKMAPPAMKLKFDTLPICGREKEFALLCEAAYRIDQLPCPEVIFISGDSGVGKTSLLKQLGNLCSSRFFITGKFDEFNRSTAIHDAMGDLCEQIASSEDFYQIRKSLTQSLGSEDSIIRNALPQIERVLGMDVDSSEHSYNVTVASHRLKLSFRSLLKAAVVTGKPVVMCIDDLHWADSESWDLFREIALDPSLKHLLLIGCYRETRTCPVNGELLAALSQQTRFQIISLRNFNVDQVNDIIVSLLRMSKEKTKSLAKIIHAKSDGNPHFSVEILKAVEKGKLIQHSLLKFCWEWDDELIQSGINIGDNVVDTYLSKINTLPVETRNVLILGSCLGAKFDALLVESLQAKIQPTTTMEIMTTEQLMDALHWASKEGLADRQRGSSIYRFAHDKIHQAFYKLVSEIARPDEMHLLIGRALLLMWKAMERKENWLCFLTATQFNRSLHLVEGSDEMTEVAEINLAAANAALAASAFRPTSNYVAHGLEVVATAGWSLYDLRLELLTLKARTDLCLGTFSGCHAAVDEVLLNAKTVEDKIPLFQVCVEAYGAESKVSSCIEQGLRFVKELGVHLPKKFNKLTVVMALIKAKKHMKGKTEEMLLNHPYAMDASKIAAVRIINTLVTYAFHARLNDMVATLAMTNTSLILNHGFTDEAGSILVVYALLLAWNGDHSVSYDIGQTSLKISERSKTGIPRTFMNFYGALDQLKNPLHKSLEPLLRGYHAGFAVGDTVYGFYCCHFYLSIFYFVGLPLENLITDMNSFSKEMEAYNMCIILNMLNVYHQSVVNLMSRTVEDPTKLNGDIMIEADALNCGVQQFTEAVWFGKLILGVYFLDTDAIRENLDKLVSRPGNLDGCMHYVPMLMWCEGYGAVLVARATKLRKYKKLAIRRFKTIENWVKGGNVNCYHSMLHLTAELAVLSKKPPEQVKTLYDSAIAASRRGGFTNMAAVANEGAALYFLALNDGDRASMYMSNAYQLYDDWGARRKCIALLREHHKCLNKEIASTELTADSSVVSRGTSFAGRKRHTSVVGRLHSGESLKCMRDESSSFKGIHEGSSQSWNEASVVKETDPFK